MPFLHAYSVTGELQWARYDFVETEPWCAASRGRRVVVGADGYLYYAGENQGGNSVHLRSPVDPSDAAPVVGYDLFTQTYGAAIDWYAFVARFDRATGEVRLGQSLLPREDERGGVFRVNALAADAAGRVLVGGQTSCCLAGRDALALAGQPVGPYREPETSIVQLSPDFRSRTSWVTWTGTTNAPSAVRSVATGSGLVAMVGEGSVGLIAHEALRAEPASGSGFFATWRAP
jgi:hypothetical protein